MDVSGIPVGNIVDAAGGALLAGLGAWVLRLRPRTRPTLGLGVFALGLGLGTALSNLATVGPAWSVAALSAAAIPLVLVAAAGLLLVGISFPGPLAGPERRWLPVALTAGAAVAAPGLLAIAAAGPPNRPLAAVPGTVLAAYAGAWAAALVLVGVFWTVLFLLALRRGAAGAGAPPVDPRATALMSAALILYPPAHAAFFLAQPDPRFHAFAAANIGAVALLALLWARNAGRGPGSTTARNLALFVPAWSLALLVNALGTGGLGAFGVARALSVLVLAYAILRHRLLGIDVKLRWTIRQSSLAAVFLAVFFAVSEAAQEVFATEGESGAYVGIAAAALLVFALAPVQRAAERLASAAVPGTTTRPPAPPHLQSVYLEQARILWADGALDARGRRLLRNLREGLGLTPEEAERLEDEASVEGRPPGGAPR